MQIGRFADNPSQVESRTRNPPTRSWQNGWLLLATIGALSMLGCASSGPGSGPSCSQGMAPVVIGLAADFCKTGKVNVTPLGGQASVLYSGWRSRQSFCVPEHLVQAFQSPALYAIAESINQEWLEQQRSKCL